jgi:dinuclear metal center YbgI/SA1388 family protein
MIGRDELVGYLDQYLGARLGSDYCPNGQQIEGDRAIQKLAVGVTASLEFLKQAGSWGADAALVHHGLFWRSAGEMRIERSLRLRIKTVLDHGYTLLAYHLPLDRHLEVGNNAVLARALGATQLEPAFLADGLPVGVIARFEPGRKLDQLVAAITHVTQRTPLVEAAGPDSIGCVGIVTGAAPRLLEDAVRLGCQMFITGEPSEAAIHLAREERIHFVAAGHHATERFGVKALGDHLGQKFGLEIRYFEVPNPV